MMNGPKYSTEEIRAVWEKEGKQRWDGQMHGRGFGLLISNFGEIRTRSANVQLV